MVAPASVRREGLALSAREDIYARVRKNRPAGEHALPPVPTFAIQGAERRLELFARMLQAMGGRLSQSSEVGAPLPWIRQQFPETKIICSAVPEVAGDRELSTVRRPQDLADVDVAVVRAVLGVAESGSVLLTDVELKVNTLAYLAQHLVVLLRAKDIVAGLQEAYKNAAFRSARYAVFHTGPSATGDIEGVLVHGAQGVRSLTVILDD
jgi:L-lactate dehydrogenase complex protein LldG